MASVYSREGRAHWFAKVRDPKTLKWRGLRTPFRVDAAAGKRNALVWANDRDRIGAENIRLARNEVFAGWVVPWLQQFYGYNEKTLARYLTAWAHLFEFLAERGLLHPRDVAYRHAGEYLSWRMAQRRRRGTSINHNTALTEMKVLSRILREAVRRELIGANPWAQLGIRRQRVRHAPAMSRDEIGLHRAALLKLEGGLPIGKRWRSVSFELALHQGLRLSATSIPMERIHLDPRSDAARGINLDRMTVFTKGRNGEPKVQVLPVHPAVRGLLLALRAAGARVTCELPKMAAKEWWKFRRDHGLAHLRFHSTRATLATEFAKNNVSQQKAMEVFGHKSVAVHQAYLHLSASDVADELGGVDFSTPALRARRGGRRSTG